VTLELTEIEIDVQGHRVNCRSYYNDTEYHIESADLPAVAVADCVKALRRESRRRTGKRCMRIGLELDISESEKAMWDYNILGIWMDCKTSHIDLQFTANSSVGMHQDEVQDIVQSRIQGTDFSICEIRTANFEYPAIESDGYRSWVVDVRLPLSSEATFHELLSMRKDVCQEVFLPGPQLSSPYMILRAMQFGRLDVVLGTPESEVLEAKSSAYDLKKGDEAAWKTELSQDVAQFANAHGGLLLIGYHTKKQNGRDLIDRLTPVQPKPTRLQSYADILKAHIHPPVSGLQLGSVPIAGNEIIYFYVPPQPEESKPFLVTGTFVDGCHIPSGISIVRRQGDGCVHVSAQEIHAAIVAGRAFIRGAARSGK